MSTKSAMESLGLRDFSENVRPPTTSNSVVNMSPETVKSDAESTRIVVHYRFPTLVEAFLDHKRAYGSAAEKALYTPDWTWKRQVARLIEKRALVFLNAHDYTVLRDGRTIGTAYREWDRVGTDEEHKNTHLFLNDYLSYDEIMLGSLIGVSGPSFFINDGARTNCGKTRGPAHEPRGIIIGLVGPRFEREDRMDSAYVLRPVDQPRQHPQLREIFCQFFGRRQKPDLNFDEKMYRARIRITADVLLLEANARAKEAGKKAYVYVVGLGLGVWKHPGIDQAPSYVAAFCETLEQLHASLENIAVLEFGYVGNMADWDKYTFNFGLSPNSVAVRFTRRNPAEKLQGKDAEHLLVLSYAWDGNAFPGNEYWIGSLDGTGDPAAACMSTIGELHNPMINSRFLERIEVARPVGNEAR
ncbi:hypothetical protein F5Y17DRAFT_440811 [Xylariaceae sp. FL0594]|nr:hypothetical protein F5Y17DRAFT_440811 [Xylariaceae sp. FL0594]